MSKYRKILKDQIKQQGAKTRADRALVYEAARKASLRFKSSERKKILRSLELAAIQIEEEYNEYSQNIREHSQTKRISGDFSEVTVSAQQDPKSNAFSDSIRSGKSFMLDYFRKAQPIHFGAISIVTLVLAFFFLWPSSDRSVNNRQVDPVADQAEPTSGTLLESRFPKDHSSLVTMPPLEGNPGTGAIRVVNGKLQANANTVIGFEERFPFEPNAAYFLEVGLSGFAASDPGVHMKAGLAAFTKDGELIRASNEMHRYMIATGRIDPGVASNQGSATFNSLSFSIGNERNDQMPYETAYVTPVIYFWFERPGMTVNLEYITLQKF